MTSTAGSAVRLRWRAEKAIPEAFREQLVGPGAPFEIGTEMIHGRSYEVFVRRPKSLRSMFDRSRTRFGHLPFLVSTTKSRTFDEAVAEIDRIAAVLARDYGIVRGSRVAIVSANSPEYALIMWAIASLGAVIVSLNGWWSADELRYGIDLGQPAVILGDERRLERLVGLDYGPIPTETIDSLVTRAAEPGVEPAPVAVVDEDDPIVLLFTSGTTGRPKAAVLSHRNVLNFCSGTMLSGALGALMIGARAPAGDQPAPTQPASLTVSPMFHISGLVAVFMTGPTMGTKLVFPAPGRWDPTTHLDLTVAHGVSVWSGVPTQLWRLVRHPDLDQYDLRHLRRVGSGGAPFPPELVTAYQQRFPWIVLGNGYGMSETVGVGTITNGALMVSEPTSVGGAQPTTEVEVRDGEGRALPEGAIGEIHLRSPSVFLGYWNNPEATAASLDADGWYRTGDFGRIERGLLFLESRMRDLILRGGENIYPIEVENRLAEHPDIDDAAVIGVPHEELGQEVKAVVVQRCGASLTAADVQRWVAEKLAPFKVPAHVAIEQALPYNEAGKVNKVELERQHGAEMR